MSQQKKQPAWYRFLHPSSHDIGSPTTHQNANVLTELKIITENDLKIESILMEEFRFKGDFLKQVSSDATSTFNLYFLSLGISISGISVLYNLVDKSLSYVQVLSILFCIVFGISNSLFFVRFISIVHAYERHKAVMNSIREYYIKHLQTQMPDVRSALYIPLAYSVPFIYSFLLFSLFAMLDSLCFAGAVFVLTEFWLNIHLSTLLSPPSDFRPYIIAVLIFIFALISHILFYKFTLYNSLKHMYKIR
jgi:hypothetical protein